MTTAFWRGSGCYRWRKFFFLLETVLVGLLTILFPVAIASVYLTFADSFAIRSGIWFFDPNQHLTWKIGPYVPVEEFLFFIITSLLVAQSVILFLPNRLRV